MKDLPNFTIVRWFLQLFISTLRFSSNQRKDKNYMVTQKLHLIERSFGYITSDMIENLSKHFRFLNITEIFKA